MPAMGPQPSEEELKVRATEALEALARASGAKGHIWMVIKGDGGKIGGCSPSLRPYGAALMDEVEKATEKPVIVTSKREPSGLLKAEKVLHTLAKTKHVELHPIVATMIQGLNEINNHKHPRVMAITDPSTMPAWFPFPPAVYAPRAQKMDLHQLFHVIDVIFGQVRGNLHAIQTLHSMLDRVYKSGSCSIGTRAGIDSFFEFLEDEAIAKMGKVTSGLVKEEVHDDVIPAQAASETSGVGGEGDGEAEAASRKRARSADAPGGFANAPGVFPDALLPSASPGHSAANSTPANGAPNPDDEIDFEKYMSEEGGQFLAEFDALTRPQPQPPQPFWDAAPAIVPAPMPPSELAVAFDADVAIEESGPGAHIWEYRSSGELTHSTGQSTLATNGSDALQQSNDGTFQAASGNGHNSTPTSSRNWAPEWFAEPGDLYPRPDVAPRQHGVPLLGNDEALVRARLQQQMNLAEQEWPAGGQFMGYRSPTEAADFAPGGHNAGFRSPPEAAAFPPRLARNDGLSESMRRDFLPQQGAYPPGTYNDDYIRFGGAPNGMEPRLRQVAIAMARAPSFCPSPSLQDRPPPAPPQVPPPAAQPQASKSGGILQKAKVLIAGAPKPRPPPEKAEPFPYSRSAPLGVATAPSDGPRSREFEPLGRSRSGDQPQGAFSGPLSGRKGSGEKDRRGLPGPLQSWGDSPKSGDLNERSISREGRQGSGDLSAKQCAGDSSGKALKVLGLEEHGGPGSTGGSLGWTGSQDGSGSFDEDGESGGGKKGLARFLPKLGRGKGKAAKESEKSSKEDSALYRDRSLGGQSTGSVSSGSDVPLPSQGSGGWFATEILPRQGSGPISGGQSPPPDSLYEPLGRTPPGECEAFPRRRDVQRFDSFRSVGSLTSDEPESDACESFPFRRPAPQTEKGFPSQRPGAESEGLQRLMQRLSVYEGVDPAADRSAADFATKTARTVLPAAASRQQNGVAVKEAEMGSQEKARAENGMSPRSILTEGPSVGTPARRVRGRVSGENAYDEEEEEPKSPAFALGIGTEDEVDFDDDTGVSHVGPSARSAPATVVSVRIISDAAAVTALPAVPVTKAPGSHAPGTQRGVIAAAPVVDGVAPVNGRATEGAVHDDPLVRLQRLRVGVGS